MRKLRRVITAALIDAGRAESLMSDARARRALRGDPERVLRTFELHGQVFEDGSPLREPRPDVGYVGFGEVRPQSART